MTNVGHFDFKSISKMKLITFICIAILLTSTLAGNVEEKFKASQIVPDMIPKAPQVQLDVEFECGNTTLGNKFTPLQVRNRPYVAYDNAKDSEFYTLIMSDLDAPSKTDPHDREWQHWLVTNIAGNQLGKGTFLTAFFPSAPAKGTGEHRYVLLWYKQPGKIDFQGYVKLGTFQMNGREKFSTRKFAEKYKLGDPVAGNFYVASWDDSIVELEKMIKDANL